MTTLDDQLSFADAILETIGLPLLALDSDLRVQVVNDAFLCQFRVTREETVGQLVYELGNGQWDIPELRRLLGDILPSDTSVRDYRVEHVFPDIGRKVMRLNAKCIRRTDGGDSILLVIDDDTERERLQLELEGRIEFADKLIASIREALLILTWDLRVHSANSVFYDLFHVDPSETEGRLVYELGNGQWNIPELRRLLEEVLPEAKAFDDYEVHHTFDEIGPRVMLLNGRRLDHVDQIVLAIRDVTERKTLEQQRASELAAMIELQRLGAISVREDDLRVLLAAVVDSAIAITGADFCTVQLLDPKTGDLRIVAQHGFEQWWLEYWNSAARGSGTCGSALDRGERVIAEDILSSPIFIGRPSLDIQRRAGVRAVQSTPLIGWSGQQVGVLSTHHRQPHRWDERMLRLIDLLARQAADIIARNEAEVTLRENEQLQRQAIAAADAGSWKVNTVTGEFIASDRALELHGLAPGTPMTHERALACVHPDDRASVAAALQHTTQTGEPFKAELRAPQPDGSVRWIASYAERYVQAGQPILVGLVHDISGRKRHEQQVQLLMREVNHRSKNMLSLIQAIAHQTASTDLEDFLPRFDERVQSLGAAQDLLVKNEWKAVPIGDLVRSQLQYFSNLIGSRIIVNGPPLLLSSEATQAIGMALHELATNAAKYGALSNDTGTVEVAWHVEDGVRGGKTFVMSWSEAGGPAVAKPARRGFGSSVTTSMVEWSVGGSVSIEFAAEGVIWKLNADAANVLEAGYEHALPLRRNPKTRRVLVVEDEPIIAADAASMLANEGFEVVGPASNVTGALALIEREGCDAAVLDVRLRNETSEPIAARLNADRTPFVILTGYSVAQIPEALRAAPLISKPLRRSALKTALDNCLRHAASDRD